MMKFSWKGFKRAGRNNKKVDRMDKTFSSISVVYLDLMVINYLIISRDKLTKIKDEAHSGILMTNKVKEHIGFLI